MHAAKKDKCNVSHPTLKKDQPDITVSISVEKINYKRGKKLALSLQS